MQLTASVHGCHPGGGLPVIVVPTEMESSQATTCLPWQPGMERKENKEFPVLPSRESNISVNVQQHLTSSSSSSSGSRHQTWGQAVCENHCIIALSYTEPQLGGIYCRGISCQQKSMFNWKNVNFLWHNSLYDKVIWNELILFNTFRSIHANIYFVIKICFFLQIFVSTFLCW